MGPSSPGLGLGVAHQTPAGSPAMQGTGPKSPLGYVRIVGSSIGRAILAARVPRSKPKNRGTSGEPMRNQNGEGERLEGSA